MSKRKKRVVSKNDMLNLLELRLAVAAHCQSLRSVVTQGTGVPCPTYADKGATMKAIAHHPPDEMYQSGLEIECQCARCGSSIDSQQCEECEDGFDGHDCGEDCCCCLYPEDNVPCQYCDGTGTWHRCLSSPEWCEANPLPGRENVQRGEIEWFTIKEQGSDQPTPTSQ